MSTLALAASIALDSPSPANHDEAAESSKAPIEEPSATVPTAPPKAEDSRKIPSPLAVPTVDRMEPGVDVATGTTPRLLQPSVGVGVTIGLGAEPNTVPGVSAFFRLSSRGLSAAFEGRAEGRGSAAVATGGEVRTSLWVGSFIPCVHIEPWFVCGVGTMGSFLVEGNGLAAPRSEHTLYAGAGARGGFEVPLVGPISFWANVDLSANLTRPELQVDGIRVWKAPPISVLTGAGLWARFL